MSRLTFKTSKPIEPTPPSRMDVAMFVGFVSRRENISAPEVVLDWLKKNGFASADELLDVPVPIESWEISGGLGVLGHLVQVLCLATWCQLV